MGLIKCKECGSEVSAKAASCPHCGAPVKTERKNYGCGTLLLGLFIIVIFMSIFSTDDAAEPDSKKPKTAEELRKDEIGKCFSGWDGSHRNLEKIVKQSMNDPVSYEHEETIYWDKDDHLIVKLTFRGKNAFGGVVRNWVTAKTSLNCDVVELIQQGP